MKQIGTALGRESDPQTIVRKLRQISQQRTFQEHCQTLAEKFTTQIYYENARTWRQAAWAGSRGSDIYKAVMKELKEGRVGVVYAAKITDNVRYIKTLPEKLAGEFTDYIQHESLRGRRASEIARDLISLFPDKSEKGVQLIARTEASKTMTALVQARAQELNLPWYVWRTSNNDGRVRKSHAHMEGVLVRWDDPPSPEVLTGQQDYGRYHAGDIFNCRCYPEPVLGIEYVQFPAKVYRGGAITRMTRAQFERITA